jgi:hypothetical protein|tara:strand:- start:273 stop:587 length:315 start_codon:yes stop_codon:yes gene_type:complete
LAGKDVGDVVLNGDNFLNPPVHAMINDCTKGMESDLLEKICESNTIISCRKTHVRLTRARAKTITIKPRDVGTDQEGWSVDEKEIPCNTLEEAIIVGLEILNRG